MRCVGTWHQDKQVCIFTRVSQNGTDEVGIFFLIFPEKNCMIFFYILKGDIIFYVKLQERKSAGSPRGIIFIHFLLDEHFTTFDVQATLAIQLINKHLIM